MQPFFTKNTATISIWIKKLGYKKDKIKNFKVNFTNKFIDKVYLKIFNFILFVTQFFYPNAYGGSIFCKKWLHEKIKGFDETIKLGEDLDYVQRCGKQGRFRFIKGIKVYFSMRRFEDEGRLKVGIRHFLSASYRILFGQRSEE